MSTKVCSKCGVEKDGSEFDINRLQCKTCRKEHKRKYQQKYREENLEREKERSTNYRKNNPEKVRFCIMRWRKNNPEKIKLQNKTYPKTPQGKISETRHLHKRRALYKETPCTLTLKQWEKIIESQNNRCAICGKRFCKSRPPTKDHIIPLSKGGGLTFENVQALCVSCNSSKRASLDHTKLVTWGIFS